MLIHLKKYRFNMKQRIAEQRRKDWDKKLKLIQTVSIFDTQAAKEAKAALQALRSQDWK